MPTKRELQARITKLEGSVDEWRTKWYNEVTSHSTNYARLSQAVEDEFGITGEDLMIAVDVKEQKAAEREILRVLKEAKRGRV